MKHNNRLQKFLYIIFSLSLILLLAVPSQVLAQEEMPQPEPAAEAPAAETPAEAPAAEVPAAEAPAAELPAEVPAAEDPLSEELAIEEPVLVAPAIEEPVIEESAAEQSDGDEPAAEEVFVEVVEMLAAEEVVLVDESGEEIPLASQEAAEALMGGDPWFLANDGSGEVIGYTSLLGSCAPPVTICNYVMYPVQAAINDPRSDWQDITIEGDYYEQIKIVDKVVNLIGATTGGGLYAPGQLGYNFTMDGTDVFSLIYIENSHVNIQGLTINGSGGFVESSGSDIYSGVTFNNATGSVVGSSINGFMDSSKSDQGVGILVYNSSWVNIEQNKITNAETGVMVEDSYGTYVTHNKIHGISNDDSETETVGIEIDDSYNTYVTHNEIYDIHSLAWFMKAYGVKVDDSGETYLIYNSIHDIRDPSCSGWFCGAFEWLTGYGYDGFGVNINDSDDTYLHSNDIFDNDKGVTIDESHNWWTEDTVLEGNNILDNDEYNLKNDTKHFLDADANYWGVDYWPNPGGWKGEWVDEGFCLWWKNGNCLFWIPVPNWYDGFKQLAKLEGVNEDEIVDPLYSENAWGGPVLDVDSDGMFTYDNCPWDANGDQADFDNDGHGDTCDNDDDSDDIDDIVDNCLLEFNPDQTDSDGDGIGNECDPTPYPPSPEEEPIVPFTDVVPVTGLIPVTGGQLVQLPCDNECVTLQLPDGSWAEFCGLCDYWASLTEETGETMPYDLPEGKTMLKGMTVVLMDPAQVLLNSLPAGATLQVGFPKGGEVASGLLIDFYDTSVSNWLELPAVDSADYLQAFLQMPGTSIFCK